MPMLFKKWERWYNNQPMASDIHGNIYYENKLQGVPRFRQVAWLYCSITHLYGFILVSDTSILFMYGIGINTESF